MSCYSLDCQTSTPRFSYPSELKLGTAGFLQCHPIAGNFQLINGSCEWCFNFDPVLVAELVPAAHIPDKDDAILGKFPNSCVRTS